MKRFFLALILLFSFVVKIEATVISISPYIWYEINSMGGSTIIIEPPTMEVGVGPWRAKAFWEYSVSDITSQLSTIDSALITINNIGWTHFIQVFTYQADAIPTFSDWSNWNMPGTMRQGMLYGWDDPFERDPSNVFDLTDGLNMALANDYEYFGVLIDAPGNINTFSEVLSNAEITVIGTSIPNPIPEPTTMLLLGSGLIALLGFRRKLRGR